MRRLLLSVSAAALVCGVIGSPSASAQQMFNIYLGGFVPASLDARDSNDVILNNSTFLSTFNRSSTIDMGKFNGAIVGGEYLVALGHNVEAGLGIGYYQRTVLTSYTDVVDDRDGSEIAQDLKLRIAPFTATFKVLPFGNDNPIQPYVGAGVGAFMYRYTESGRFVASDNSIISGTFTGSGAAAGPVVFGGLRAETPFGTIGGEIKYQHAIGKLPASEGFAGSKVDLSGMNYLFTLSFKL